ncbi:arginyl-tRNA--protein transferase 2-like [Impatiens glandulifera]|uniref:arginyl-tRNA--protein transferase 2-like n=1 Tax=Impatiens glandulifera TaxID=253017 RepID=UPI001FB14538|nr:arginyl-tRNA--protein transferase 2-like [Impatiens glandulifera]
MTENKKLRNEASGSGSNRGESVVGDVGRRRNSCGYCKSGGNSSISHGLWANSLTVDDYQALLDRGWRRSGCFLYKPEMERTCCPSYTIRLKADEFVPLKEHLRVSKKMQRFLDGTVDMTKKDMSVDERSTRKGSCSNMPMEGKCLATEKTSQINPGGQNEVEGCILHLSKQIDSAVLAFSQNVDLPCDIKLPKASVRIILPAKRKTLVQGSEDLLFSSNIAFQVAATLRHVQKDVQSADIIADKLAISVGQLVENSSLLVRSSRGHLNFYSPNNILLREAVERDVVSKKSHTGPVDKGICSNTLPGCTHNKRKKLEIELKRSTFDPEEFALYKRYQIKVHNDTPDKVTESSYSRFLVDTPLIFVPSKGDGVVPPCGFGSFHQQYRIDGKLVAVGVIDILPKCLSSKYLFWDPDLAFLSLGKYSALQEISWVKTNHLFCHSLEYYYLGYYIHSCSKMRYKASYSPSELLCPLRYEWVLFNIARPLLDKKSYVVLSDYASLPVEESSTANIPENHVEVKHSRNGDEDMNDIHIENDVDDDEEIDELDSEESDDDDSGYTDGSIANTLIGLRRSRLRYKDLEHAFGSTERRYLETQLRRYNKAVGSELSERMVYSVG